MNKTILFSPTLTHLENAIQYTKQLAKQYFNQLAKQYANQHAKQHTIKQQLARQHANRQ